MTEILFARLDDVDVAAAVAAQEAAEAAQAAAEAAAAIAGGLSIVVELTDGATVDLDASAGNLYTLAAAGNRTINVPTNPTDGKKIIIRHLASGAARTLTLDTSAGGFRFGTDLTAITETDSGTMDYIGCIYNGDDDFWDVVAYVKGL